MPPSYREIAPDPALRPWVECCWIASGEAEARDVLPDGCIDFLFDAADGTARLIGAMTRPEPVPAGACDLTAVRFRPGGAHAVLGLPMHELTDAAVPLADLGRALRELAARIGDARDAAARLSVLEAWLLARRPARHDAIGCALRTLEQARGRCRVDDLAAAAGTSRQWFARSVRERTGLAPKLLARILRLRAAAATRRPGEPLAALALRCGFADQAHLARDARELFGAPPSRW
ncbi:MAG: DUF6597 domain-containing transcriptional factor [Planctomycetota bacterium]